MKLTPLLCIKGTATQRENLLDRHNNDNASFLGLAFLCCLYSDFRLFCVISEFFFGCYIYFLILNYILRFLIFFFCHTIRHIPPECRPSPQAGSVDCPKLKKSYNTNIRSFKFIIICLIL